MLGGLYAIYSNKNLMGKDHWTSWHAWGGLFALALWAANVALAGSNTADLGKKRLVFLWQSRKHRSEHIETVRVVFAIVLPQVAKAFFTVRCAR